PSFVHSTLCASPQAGRTQALFFVTGSHLPILPTATSGGLLKLARIAALTFSSRDMAKLGKLPNACRSSGPSQSFVILRLPSETSDAADPPFDASVTSNRSFASQNMAFGEVGRLAVTFSAEPPEAEITIRSPP